MAGSSCRPGSALPSRSDHTLLSLSAPWASSLTSGHENTCPDDLTGRYTQGASQVTSAEVLRKQDTISFSFLPSSLSYSRSGSFQGGSLSQNVTCCEAPEITLALKRDPGPSSHDCLSQKGQGDENRKWPSRHRGVPSRCRRCTEEQEGKVLRQSRGCARWWGDGRRSVSLPSIFLRFPDGLQGALSSGNNESHHSQF